MKLKNSLIILILILIAGFFRLYKLEQNSVFYADEERDAYVIKTIIKDHHLTLIGPSTSVGNIYLGPAWYYFILPWYVILNGDPIASPIAVSFMGILTTVLFFLFGKEIFNNKVAYVSAILYGSSSYIVSITNRAWNPSVIPMISLIFFYSLFKIRKGFINYWWVIIFCLGLGIQFHLSAILLFLFTLLFILSTKPKFPTKNILFIQILLFILLISPIIIFDLRHNFQNLTAIFIFLANILKGFKFNDQRVVINDYYFSVFYPLSIFLIARLVEKLLNKILITTGLIIFIGFNLFLRFQLRVPLSLYDKKSIVKKLIAGVNDHRFNLRFFSSEDFKYGWHYLFYFYGSVPQTSPVDFSYRHLYQPKNNKTNINVDICSVKEDKCNACKNHSKFLTEAIIACVSN